MCVFGSQEANCIQDGLINTPVTIQSDTPGKPTKDIKKLPLIRGQKPAKNNQNRESVASCQSTLGGYTRHHYFDGFSDDQLHRSGGDAASVGERTLRFAES